MLQGDLSHERAYAKSCINILALSVGIEKKLLSTERKKGRKNGVIMDVGWSSAQKGDMGLSEFVTMREIANEAREKVMHEQMEWMEK